MGEPAIGFFSLLPPLLAIILAIRSRQVYLSLGLGIFLGYLILNGWNPVQGFFATLNGLVEVFKDPGSTRTIMFSAMVGSLIAVVQRSGGVAGFIVYMERRLTSANNNGRRRVELAAYITGMLIFVESSISVLTVGSIFRPLTDKLKIPREKLAYLADSSSAPSCILIPFNAWGAYIMGLLAAGGIAQPFRTLAGAFPYNFYPILTVGLAFYLIFSRKDFGAMKKAEERAATSGEVIRAGAQPLVSEDVTALPPKPDAKLNARNLILPISLLVILMPLMLAYTGWSEVPELGQSGSSRFISAIGQGSGSTAVLYSLSLTLIISWLLYRIQGLLSTKEFIELSLKGLADLMPLALLMLLAFAIGNVCRLLGTGPYVAEVVKGWLHPALVPALIFAVSAFVAFSTGTSWGTFAIMLAIGLPMAEELNVSLPLVLSAVMGGGVFGDHCSPISDTTILSSMATASDHIDHVRTQLPYALTAAAGTVLLYILVGWFTA
jgi:Na+/H+ antiporter NhaC